MQQQVRGCWTQSYGYTVGALNCDNATFQPVTNLHKTISGKHSYISIPKVHSDTSRTYKNNRQARAMSLLQIHKLCEGVDSDPFSTAETKLLTQGVQHLETFLYLVCQRQKEDCIFLIN